MLLPQMAPMWWTYLMFMFIFTFLLLMIMLYFNLNNTVSKSYNFSVMKKNWKW